MIGSVRTPTPPYPFFPRAIVADSYGYGITAQVSRNRFVPRARAILSTGKRFRCADSCAVLDIELPSNMSGRLEHRVIDEPMEKVRSGGA